MGRKWIVYLTVNSINRKIYVGVHTTKTPQKFDGYLGSGKHLKRAINLYGKENFKRIVLFVYDKEEKAYLKEVEIVTPEFVARKDTYNFNIGGMGCGSGKNHPSYGTHPTEEQKKVRSKGRERYWNSPEGEKEKKRRSENLKGENNPMFGKCSLNRFSDELIKERLLDIENIPKEWGWTKLLAKKWGVKRETVTSFIRGYISDTANFYIAPNPLLNSYSHATLSDCVIKQRRLDIENEPKIPKWREKLSIKWGISYKGVCFFISYYCSNTEQLSNITRDLITQQRREDIKNEPKIWGWKSKLGRKWKIVQSAANMFINKYALDLITEINPIVIQRRLDVEAEPKTLGYKNRLAKKWGLNSSSSVTKFIKKYASDLI